MSDNAKPYWDRFCLYIKDDSDNPTVYSLLEHACEVAYLCRRMLNEITSIPYIDPDKKDCRLTQYQQYCTLLSQLVSHLRRGRVAKKDREPKAIPLTERELLMKELDIFEQSL